MPRAALQDHPSNPTRLRSSDGRIWKYSLNVLEKCEESEKPQSSAISVMGRSVCSTSHFARDNCRLRRYSRTLMPMSLSKRRCNCRLLMPSECASEGRSEEKRRNSSHYCGTRMKYY